MSKPGMLQLNGINPGQGGVVGLTLQQATPGAPYAIQFSTNLINWLPLGTNMAGTNGTLQFNDTNVTGVSKRFYRGQAL